MKRFALALALSLCACTDDSATVRTLHNAGYTNVRTTGYEWFECGEDDTYHTGFVANNPRGQTVPFTVCCGMIAKGCTIRF